ncbi:hypothetical protein Tco_0012931 [Tanacetum coccineum]
MQISALKQRLARKSPQRNHGIDEQIEGTEEQIESTDGQRKGTEDHTEEGSATQATQTPTSTIFGDDETIAKVLLNMSQAKAVSREKEKAEKKFKQLESDEEMARKIQEEWEGEEERNRIAEEKATNEALIRNFDDIKARIEADRLLAKKLQEQEREQFTIEERAKKTLKPLNENQEVEEILALYEKIEEQDWNIVSWKLHGSSGVHTLVTETGLVIHMLVEKKYPLRKKVLVQMLKLKLESEEDSTMALELIRFIKKLLAELEPKDFDGDEEDL